MHGLVPYKGDKGDKNAARPPEGSLVETRCLIKGPKSAIVPFPGPRSGPKSRTGPGALAKKSVPPQPTATKAKTHATRSVYHCSQPVEVRPGPVDQHTWSTRGKESSEQTWYHVELHSETLEAAEC